MSFISPLTLSHQLLKASLAPDDWAIDATVGQGYDTSFLCQQLPQGKIFAFDIQKEAIAIAQKRVSASTGQIEWIEDSHAHFNAHLPNCQGKIAAIMYNLGYLPGGDKNITTQVTSTLESLAQALHLLKAGGLITLMVYPGHPEGQREKEALLSYCRTLDQSKVDVYSYQAINQQHHPAFLLVLQKK